MKVFIATLTIYTYNDRTRVRLNQEEVEKFIEALSYAKEFDKGIVFSDYTINELQKISKTLTKREAELYHDLITKIKNFKYVPAILSDYEASYDIIYKTIYNLIEAHISEEKIKLKINVSCGHKMGSFALYLAVMNLIDSTEFYKFFNARSGDRLVVDMYHAEKGIIEKLPILHFETEKKGKWDEYLFLLKTPKTIEEFRSTVKENVDKIIMYFKKHEYIKMINDKLYLTEKGKTLVHLLEKIS